jgi:MATE family multidrug resistance protein
MSSIPSSSWASHYWATIRLALPLIVGQVALISIWTADIIMMGGISAEALAAGSQANRLYQPLYFIALGLTLAVSPLTSQALGAMRRWQARRVVRQGIWLAIIYGIITMIPMWNGETLLLMLRQDPGIASEADLFLKASAPGMVPAYIFMVLRHYASAHKRPLPPVITLLFGVSANIFLNWVFINGHFGMPALGLVGIGLATSLTFLIMALVLAIYINTQKPFNYTRPFARFYRFDPAVTKQILIVGLPIGVMLLAETGMFIVAGLYIGIYGKIAVAAAGIAIQIAATTFMVPLAISQAATIRVGHEGGADHPVEAARAGIAATILVIFATLGLTVLLLTGGEFLVGLFLDTADPLFDAVLVVALPMLFVIAIFQCVDGLQAVFSAVLRGINDTRWPAAISILCYWCIGLGSGIFLADAMNLGPIGVWWGLFNGLFAGSVLLFIRCVKTMRKIIKENHIHLH